MNKTGKGNSRFDIIIKQFHPEKGIGIRSMNTVMSNEIHFQNRLIRIEIQKLGIRSENIEIRSILKESDPLDRNRI